VSCCTAVQCQWPCLCWGWDSKKLLLPCRDLWMSMWIITERWQGRTCHQLKVVVQRGGL
jgi:hypothetical protein